jgi:hypothetical protein
MENFDFSDGILHECLDLKEEQKRIGSFKFDNKTANMYMGFYDGRTYVKMYQEMDDGSEVDAWEHSLFEFEPPKTVTHLRRFLQEYIKTVLKPTRR